MVQMLRSLRVSAEMDSTAYVAGSKQKVAADQAMVASGHAFGASLADVDAGLNSLPKGMARLSRMWVDGYRDAEKFQKALYQIDKALGKSMDVDRAVVMLGNLEKAFGRTISQTDLLKQKLTALQTPFSTLRVQGGIDEMHGIGRSPTNSAAASASVFAAAAAEENDRLSASAKRLLAELYPVDAAQERLNAHLAEYATLAKQGYISQNALSDASMVAQKNFAYVAENASRMGKGVRLSRFEMQNLSYQLNDIAVMTASGQAPFVMLMQQGMQISQIIGPQGLAGGMKALGTSILAFVLNPTNLAVVGFAALAAGAVYAYHQMGSGLPKIEELLKSQKTILDELSKSYAGIGLKVAEIGREGVSVVQFEARINVEQSKKRILEDLKTLSAVEGPARAMGYLSPEKMPFKNAIENLRQSVKDGKPDLEAYRLAIADIANTPGATKITKDLAASALEASGPVSDLARQMKQLADSIDPLFVSMQRRMGAITPLLGQVQPEKALRSFVPDTRSQNEQLQTTLSLLIKNASSVKEVEGYTDLAAKAQGYWNTELSKSVQLGALDLQAIYAKSPAEKAAIAGKRELVTAINSGVDAGMLEVKVQQAMAQAYQQATFAITEQNHSRAVAANDNLAQAQLEVRLVGATAEQRALATANLASYLDLQKQAYSTGTAFDVSQYEALKMMNAERASEVGLLEKINTQRDLNNQKKYASMLPGDQKVAQFMDGKNIKEGTQDWSNYAQSIRETQVVSLQLQLTNEALYKSLSPREADIAKQLDTAGIERYSAAWYNLAAQIRETQKETQSFGYGVKTAFQTITDDANNYAASSSQIVNDLYNGLEDVWVDFAKTGKFNFGSLIDTMIADLERFAYKLAMSGLLNSIGGGSSAGSGSGGILSTIIGTIGSLFGGGTMGANDFYNANGNAFNDNGVMRFGMGGSFSNSIVHGPTSFRYGGGRRGEMGEAGPEAVMPLTRTSSGKLGVAVSGNDNSSRGAQPMKVIINNFTSAQVETSQDSSGAPVINIGKMLDDKLEGQYGLKKVQNRRN